MNIEENNILIRNFKEEDLNDLYSLLSDSEVMEYIEDVYDYSKTENFFRKYCLSELPLVYACLVNNRFIGYVIYHLYEKNSFEIGWIIKKEYWGYNYASYLTDILIRYSKGKISRLIIECDSKQLASKKIANKFGFKYLGKDDNCEVYYLDL